MADGHDAYKRGNDVADEADGKKTKGGLLDRILPRPRSSDAPAPSFDDILKGQKGRGKRGRIA